MTHERLPIIRASEIGEYVYCTRAWWLRRVVGLEPAQRARLERGIVMHRRHGRAVAGSQVLLSIGVGLAIVALVFMVLAR